MTFTYCSTCYLFLFYVPGIELREVNSIPPPHISSTICVLKIYLFCWYIGVIPRTFPL
jgi:hypothetical protein